MLEHLREAINVAVTKASVASGHGEGSRGRAVPGHLHYQDLLAPMPSALASIRLRVSPVDEEAHKALVDLQSPRDLDVVRYDLAMEVVRGLIERGVAEYPFLRGVLASVDEARGRPRGSKIRRLVWAETMIACIRLNDLFEVHTEGCLGRSTLLRAVHHSLGSDAVREGLLAFASMTCCAKRHLTTAASPWPDATGAALREVDASASKRARRVVVYGDASGDDDDDDDDVPLSALVCRGFLGAGGRA